MNSEQRMRLGGTVCMALGLAAVVVILVLSGSPSGAIVRPRVTPNTAPQPLTFEQEQELSLFGAFVNLLPRSGLIPSPAPTATVTASPAG